MRKKTKKYANIITNLQYLQFMKDVAGRVFETPDQQEVKPQEVKPEEVKPQEVKP